MAKFSGHDIKISVRRRTQKTFDMHTGAGKQNVLEVTVKNNSKTDLTQLHVGYEVYSGRAKQPDVLSLGPQMLEGGKEAVVLGAKQTHTFTLPTDGRGYALPTYVGGKTADGEIFNKKRSPKDYGTTWENFRASRKGFLAKLAAVVFMGTWVGMMYMTANKKHEIAAQKQAVTSQGVTPLLHHKHEHAAGSATTPEIAAPQQSTNAGPVYKPHHTVTAVASGGLDPDRNKPNATVTRGVKYDNCTIDTGLAVHVVEGKRGFDLPDNVCTDRKNRHAAAPVKLDSDKISQNAGPARPGYSFASVRFNGRPVASKDLG